MPAPIDLTNHVYGRLTVLHESVPATYPRKWICKCECGNIKEIVGKSLRYGATQSCGCLNKELVSARAIIHGDHNSHLYSVWHNMKQRCGNPKHTAYSFYGELGITVCPEWEDYAAFKDWANTAGYASNLSLDRKEGDKGYYPDNCHWTNKTIQARNQKVRNTNTSGHRGVSYVARLNKYQAYLTVNYKKVNLGHFTDINDAVAARAAYISTNNLGGFPSN